jgi:hypothetical protein
VVGLLNFRVDWGLVHFRERNATALRAAVVLDAYQKTLKVVCTAGKDELTW